MKHQITTCLRRFKLFAFFFPNLLCHSVISWLSFAIHVCNLEYDCLLSFWIIAYICIIILWHIIQNLLHLYWESFEGVVTFLLIHQCLDIFISVLAHLHEFMSVCGLVIWLVHQSSHFRWSWVNWMISMSLIIPLDYPLCLSTFIHLVI